MIIRSFANGFEVQDWTEELNQIPNEYGLITQLGLFQEEGVAEHSVVFEEITQDGALIVDRVRGERANVSKDYTRKIHSFFVPHFPLDDYISPSEIHGRRAYGSASDAERLADVRTRKMERLNRDHSWTLNYARAQAITAGTAYAPNGTISQNWYTEFGQSQTSVDIAFTTSTTDVQGRLELGIRQIQDNLGNGGMYSGLVMLCGRNWFSALIAHAKVQTAFTYYSSTQEPLRQRLGGPLAMNRVFEWNGIKFIEMGNQYNGSYLVNQDKAYLVPTGTDMFRTYFSPAERFGLVNTLGERMYMFETADAKGTRIDIESESNFINASLRPQAIVEYTKS